MARPFTGSRIPWLTLFLPELFLGTVAGFWFAGNTPAQDGFDNRLPLCLMFLGYLLAGALLKTLLYCFPFRRRGVGQLSWSYISFFLAMIELGCFFDFYIVGYSADRTRWEIAQYALEWYIPLLMIALAGAFVSLMQNWARLPFVQRSRRRKQRKRRRGGKSAAAETPAPFAAFAEKAGAVLRDPKCLVLLMLLYAAAGAGLFFVFFRNVRSTDLARLNLRNKCIEGFRLVLFVLLLLLRYSRDCKKQGSTGISDAFAGISGFLLCGVTAGMYLLGGEFGSAIITAIFAVLTVFYFYSSRWGMVLAELGGCAYAAGFIADRVFRRTTYPAFITETLGMERWNRLYGLEQFPQVLELRTVLRQSALLRGIVPYQVSLNGKAYTRIEDFSFVNLVSVFGSIAALAVIGYYTVLLARVFYRLDNTVRSRRMPPLRTALFHTAQLAALYTLTHAAVHVVSNLTFLFFTGVPLPFVSKGLSNLLVCLVLSVLIICCLRWEEEYARTSKKAAQRSR